MVAVLDLAGLSMSENQENKKRETSGYKLYRDTMDRLVEIAAFRKLTVAELCDDVLSTLADAEYLAMLNEKREAELQRLAGKSPPTPAKPPKPPRKG